MKITLENQRAADIIAHAVVLVVRILGGTTHFFDIIYINLSIFYGSGTEQRMAREIERKFLVKSDAWKNGRQGLYCRQGYLVTGEEVTVRVRILDGEGFLTIKGRTEGIARDEFEYRIPLEDARAMLRSMSSGGIVEKIRYHIEVNGFTWDVDEFLGESSGLVLAEVELEDEDQVPEFPDWLGQEVTGDVRYYNAYLAGNPFSAWKK